MPRAEAETAALIAVYIESGQEGQVARLLSEDLTGIEGLSDEDRARIAAEITASLFED